jgi:hypothetical protein
MSKGRICLHKEAFTSSILNQILRCVAYVHQDLIYHRPDRAGLKDVLDVLFFKVGETDGTKLSRTIGFLESSPRFAVALKVSIFLAEFPPRLWAMNDHLSI